MALSDREQRLLAEMEEALSADDPRLVSTLNGTATRFSASIGIAVPAATLRNFTVSVPASASIDQPVIAQAKGTVT